jgi:hypothetical protein
MERSNDKHTATEEYIYQKTTLYTVNILKIHVDKGKAGSNDVMGHQVQSRILTEQGYSDKL